MKLIHQEAVDGTGVVIGRRVQTRKAPDGARVERASDTYTAQYYDADGKRRYEGLGTTNKREARTKALEIHRRLESGERSQKPTRLTVVELIQRYLDHCGHRGLAPKTLAKYRADLQKLSDFAAEEGLTRADRFEEQAFHRFGAWLRERSHKHGVSYADKTRYTALTVTKQAFRWGARSGLLSAYRLTEAKLPYARARPQPCFSLDQVNAILNAVRDDQVTHAAYALMAFAGLRCGEALQLQWDDVRFDIGDLGMLHVRRGGSAGRPKDKDDRFIPIHARLRPVLEALPRHGPLVLPGARDRTLLGRLKRECRRLGYGTTPKLHTFRHFFCSLCANTDGVPYRLALAWLGHDSGSEILNLYYHLSDAESARAMRALSEGNAR